MRKSIKITSSIVMFILGAIIGDVVGIIDVPLLEPIRDFFTPTKELTIYHQSIQYANETMSLKLADKILNNLFEVYAITLVQGCNQISMDIIYVKSSDILVDSSKKIHAGWSDRGLLDCENCVSYLISVVNNKDETSDNIRIRTLLFDREYKTFDEYKVKIEDASNFPGKPKFDIVIDSLKGNKEEVAMFGLITEDYNIITYDCNIVKKQYCSQVKMDSYLIRRSIDVIRILSKLGFDYTPPMSNKEFEVFEVDLDKQEFIKIEGDDVTSKFFGGKNECSTQNTAVNPKDLI